MPSEKDRVLETGNNFAMAQEAVAKKLLETVNKQDLIEVQRAQLYQRVKNDFVYHPPKGNQAQRYETIRGHAKAFAEMLIKEGVPSRELSVALTHLDEVVFWTNASIARNE